MIDKSVFKRDVAQSYLCLRKLLFTERVNALHDLCHLVIIGYRMNLFGPTVEQLEFVIKVVTFQD